MVELFGRKGPFNDWELTVLKGHTSAIRCLYYFGYIDGGYRLEMYRRSKKQVLKTKLNMPRSLKAKLAIKERRKVKNDQDKFGYKFPKNFSKARLLDKNNRNTLWDDAISKDVTALDNLGVL